MPDMTNPDLRNAQGSLMGKPHWWEVTRTVTQIESYALYFQQHTRTVLLLELNSKLRQILAKCLFPIVAQCHFDLHELAGTKEFSNTVCGLKF